MDQLVSLQATSIFTLSYPFLMKTNYGAMSIIFGSFLFVLIS